MKTNKAGKHAKRILSFILFIAILSSLLFSTSISVFAETISGTMNSGVSWSLNTSTYTLTISGKGITSGGYSASYNNGSWTLASTAPWKDYRRYINKVVIRNGIENLSSGLFMGCEVLESITIPNSVTEIGDYVFKGCSNLKKLTIPDSVTKINQNAFFGCFYLTEITLPFIGTKRQSSDATVQYPFGSVFRSSYNLGYTPTTTQYIYNSDTDSSTVQKCYIPNALKKVTITDCDYIPVGAFRGCDKLTSIVIPNGVKSIGVSAFNGCTSLTSITIPNTVTSIGRAAFAACSSLLNIKIPYGITNIEGYLFSGCSAISDITIPNTVVSISEYAFNNCSSLQKILFPESVESIDSQAFNGYRGSIYIRSKDVVLADYSIPSTATIYCYENSTAEAYSKANGINYNLFQSCGNNLCCYELNGVLNIMGTGDMNNYKTAASVPWYENKDKITEVRIESGVSKIGTYAFYCLDNLKTICIRNNDIEFGRYALNVTNGSQTVFAEPGGNIEKFCAENSIAFVDPHPAPVFVSATDKTITVNNVSGYEYSKDGITWQTSGSFTGLSPAVEYTVYMRHKNTANFFIDTEYKTITVKTDKSNVNAPAIPICIRNTDTEITLQADELYEYSIDGENWQKSNVFSGLTHKEMYNLYQRIAETETEHASPASVPLVMQLIKKTVQAPVSPDYESHTDNSITLVANELYEYSIDGDNWQKSSVFGDLAKNNVYTFYQRIAETEIEYASDKSEGLVMALPDKPTIDFASFDTVSVNIVEGFEYCLDDMVWQSSNKFYMLLDYTDYNVYQRLALIPGKKVYQITSDYTEVTTDNTLLHEHKYGDWTITKEPTCSLNGVEERICSSCGNAESRWVPAFGHTHTEVRDAKKETCCENGYAGDTYCTDCGEKIADGTTISATGNHTDEDGQWETNGTQHWHTCYYGTQFDISTHTGGTVTCTEKAKCSVCGAEYGDYAEHTLTHHAPVAPDYENSGSIEYWTCDNCDKYFSDPEGLNEISADDAIIAKLVVAEYRFIDGEIIIEAPAGAIPEGSLFSVQKDVPPPTEVVAKVKAQRGTASEGLAYYEIRLFDMGGERMIHLDGEITIKMKMPEQYIGRERVRILQEDETEKLVIMESWWEGEYLCYKTDWLEIYH